MDVDNDQFISQEELTKFLQTKAGSQDDKFFGLVQETFRLMDKDHNGKVSLDEFTTMYFSQQRRLEEDIEELESRIRDIELRQEQMREKLIELKKTERKTDHRHFKF